MRGSRKFFHRGPIFLRFLTFFSRLGGSKYNFKRAIIGPPEKRHLNGVSLADMVDQRRMLACKLCGLTGDSNQCC